ncbi:hypothetical protein SAMN05660964_00555 [Thiothrix caldifontis]|jgi:Chromosome segregation ATPases|uniref:Uncharacterized protein n=1 Tax=Thiothrix caldifontis TaxID=525918 RepID=A0A1H3X4B3_9GAMM|nr:hypothetical protein [Thiothrix caldifontis]SDZ93358.1 hypothetical protein SAMN05660964_00555 [Thiothrix caldifontis]
MFYLTIQIAFLLTLAIFIGVAIGWWVANKIKQSPTLPQETSDNPFDARFRLEQCHRENATLRRDLKETEERAEKLNARLDNSTQHDDNVLERLETYEIRLEALMEDLQMRDDTIAVLEQELEQLRDQRNNA